MIPSTAAVMLEGIFGNKTAEKVLAYLHHHGEGHARAIAKDLSLSVTPVVRQLDRFESAGVLLSKVAGRTRIYRFDPKSPRAAPVVQLVDLFYKALSAESRARMFSVRRRPRAKGKPIL